MITWLLSSGSLLRHISGNKILIPRVNQHLYEGYIGFGVNIVSYCAKNIEVIDADADDLQISALFNLLDFPIKIYNLTNSTDENVYVRKLPDSGI